MRIRIQTAVINILNLFIFDKTTFRMLLPTLSKVTVTVDNYAINRNINKSINQLSTVPKKDIFSIILLPY